LTGLVEKESSVYNKEKSKKIQTIAKIEFIATETYNSGFNETLIHMT